MAGRGLAPHRDRADRPARLGLPPVVDDGHAESIVGPVPGLGVEPLPGEEERLQRPKGAGRQPFEVGVDAPDRAERSGRREHRLDAVILHDAPELARIRRADRLAFIEDSRRARDERPVDDEGVPDHPPDVGGREHRVARADVIDVAHGPCQRDRVPARVADDALRAAGRARRVEHIERVGRDDRHGSRGRGRRRDRVPIAPAHAIDRTVHLSGRPGDRCPIAHNDGADDPGCRLECLSHDRQVLDDPAGLEPAGCRDEHRGPCVGDAHRQLGRRKAAEHDRVDRAEPGAGEHRDDRFGCHRQVQQHTIASRHAEILQRAGELRDPVAQLAVGVVLAGSGHCGVIAQCKNLSATRVHVTVEAVDAHVQRSIRKPRPCVAVVVDDALGLDAPVDGGCRIPPESGGVVDAASPLLGVSDHGRFSFETGPGARRLRRPRWYGRRYERGEDAVTPGSR